MSRFEFPVEYSFDIETKSVIATVPELNYISSFGKDFAEAEKNIIEAVLGYLEVLKMDDLPQPICQKTTNKTMLVIEMVS
jgi:predicted RNase H-like HicB family nuclease